jgi:hypothetical protein
MHHLFADWGIPVRFIFNSFCFRTICRSRPHIPVNSGGKIFKIMPFQQVTFWAAHTEQLAIGGELREARVNVATFEPKTAGA